MLCDPHTEKGISDRQDPDERCLTTAAFPDLASDLNEIPRIRIAHSARSFITASAHFGGQIINVEVLSE
jgi:hypothetical protein